MKYLLLLFTILSLLSCGGDSGSDTEVVGCLTVSGTFTVSTYTCEDTELTDVFDANNPMTYQFTSSTAVQTFGPAACQTTINYTMVAGTGNIALAGVGNLECRSGGTLVSSCADPLNTCTNTTSVDGLSNSWGTCTNFISSISLRRNTSTIQATNFSRCASGNEENISMTSQ